MRRSVRPPAPVTFPRPAAFTNIAPHGQFASATRGSIFRVIRTPSVADRHRRGHPAVCPVVRPVRQRDRRTRRRTRRRRPVPAGHRAGERRHGTTRPTAPTGQDVRLADTGSFDSTPYLIGGTAFLALGAGFVVYSVPPRDAPGLLRRPVRTAAPRR